MKHLQPSTAMFKGAAGNRLVADVFGDAAVESYRAEGIATDFIFRDPQRECPNRYRSPQGKLQRG